MTHLPHINQSKERTDRFDAIKQRWEYRHNVPLSMTEVARRIHDIGVEAIEAAYNDELSLVTQRGIVESVGLNWPIKTGWLENETVGRLVMDFFSPIPRLPWTDEKYWGTDLKKFNGGLLHCKVHMYDHGNGRFVWTVLVIKSSNGGK